jgi:CRISPR-associated protein (TIGR03986 family)
MAFETTGTLIRKTHGGKVDWSLKWADGNGKQQTPFNRNQVFQFLKDEFHAFKAGQAEVSFAVKITVQYGKLLSMVSDDAAMAGQLAEAAAAKQKADNEDAERRKAEREKAENSKAEPYADKTAWSRKEEGHFYNPYNFVPAPEGRAPVKDTTDGLADGNNMLGHYVPSGHHAFHEKLYSGTLTVELKVKTPLVIMDTARRRKDGDHDIYPVLKHGNDPVIPVTSFKGPLRSAFEAITNSRMGVLADHKERLGRRMDAREGLNLIPARVTDTGNSIELMMGTLAPAAGVKPNFTAQPSIMYAAWLPRYFPGGKSSTGPVIGNNAISLKGGGAIAHKQAVKCWIVRVKKTAKQSFEYWRVEEMVPAGGTLSAKAPTTPKLPTDHAYVMPLQTMAVDGFICLTGQSFGRKHDERVFFTAPGTVPYGNQAWTTTFPDLAKSWKALVLDYAKVHEKALKERKAKGQGPDAFMGKDPGKTAFSRHVYTPDAETLKAGDLCYAKVDASGKITDLFPVMISRELAELPPRDFVPSNIRPAAKLEELSPADRVFGWVKGDGSEKGGKNMHKGQLRIHKLVYNPGPESFAPFSDFKHLDGGKGLPLAILGEPKPQQARFYLSKDKGGTPFADGGKLNPPPYSTDAKNAGSRLRGRKFYPHHLGAAEQPGYWDGPAAFNNPARQLGTFYREYVHANKERSNQNRSIEGWVNPGCTFTAEIEVTNLNGAELGALCWLLSQGEDTFLRLGFGKPLGFGSVSTKIQSFDLKDGKAIKDDYIAFGATTASPVDTAELIEVYKASFAALFNANNFDTNHVIKAYLNAAKGQGNKPVHYPRAGLGAGLGNVSPNPEGKNFEWFVSNNKKPDRQTPEPRYSLDPLWEPAGLPALPAP